MSAPSPENNRPLLELIQYTDPYCTWCWGSEPIMRRNNSGEEFMFFGYHTFDQFAPLFKRLAGDGLTPLEIASDDESILAFVIKYGKVAPREVAEVFSLKPNEALGRLERLAAAGKIREQEAGNGWLFSAAG